MKIPMPMTIAPEPVGEEMFFIKRSLIRKNKPTSNIALSISNDVGIDAVTAHHTAAAAQTTRIVAPFRRLMSRVFIIGVLGLMS